MEWTLIHPRTCRLPTAPPPTTGGTGIGTASPTYATSNRSTSAPTSKTSNDGWRRPPSNSISPTQARFPLTVPGRATNSEHLLRTGRLAAAVGLDMKAYLRRSHQVNRRPAPFPRFRASPVLPAFLRIECSSDLEASPTRASVPHLLCQIPSVHRIRSPISQYAPQGSHRRRIITPLHPYTRSCHHDYL